MHVKPIGDIVVCVNTALVEPQWIDDEMELLIADRVISWFREEVREHIGEGALHIHALRIDRGCILLTISLGAAVAAVGGVGAVLAGAYKFVVDYDKIEKNLPKIIAALKKAYVTITRTKGDKGQETTSVQLHTAEPTEFQDVKPQGGLRMVYRRERTTTCHKVAVKADGTTETTEEILVDKETIEITGTDVKELIKAGLLQKPPGAN